VKLIGLGFPVPDAQLRQAFRQGDIGFGGAEGRFHVAPAATFADHQEKRHDVQDIQALRPEGRQFDRGAIEQDGKENEKEGRKSEKQIRQRSVEKPYYPAHRARRIELIFDDPCWFFCTFRPTTVVKVFRLSQPHH
jgi:hypothetical protein